MVSFIDAHRDAHGVEAICSVLPIAPSTYYSHLAKRADPTRQSDRARRDEALLPEILRVFEENWRVYGVRKVWRQLGREGFDITVRRFSRTGGVHPLTTVARLMKSMGIQGIIRGKPHRTTIPDRSAPCPLDKETDSSACLRRTCCGVVHCGAIGPSPMDDDFTYVATWKGFAYLRVMPSNRWRADPQLS